MQNGQHGSMPLSAQIPTRPSSRVCDKTIPGWHPSLHGMFGIRAVQHSKCRPRASV